MDETILRGIVGNSNLRSLLPFVCTSGIENMSQLFLPKSNEPSSFDENIASWDVSSVTDISSMFNQASSFNQPIGSWDMSRVEQAYSMFYGASNFNQPIGDWIVSNVVNMRGMFHDATEFNQDIRAWDVSSVTDMENMFMNATSFNQPIGEWGEKVGNVTDMQNMFRRAAAFNQDIGEWDVSKVTNMSLMLNGATAFTTANYDNILQAWSSKLPQEPEGQDADYALGAGTITYSVSSIPSRTAIENKGWTITDGGLMLEALVLASAVENSATVTAEDTLFFTVNGDEVLLTDEHSFIWNNNVEQNEGLTNATPFFVAAKAQWGVKVSDIISATTAAGNYTYTLKAELNGISSNTLELGFTLSTPRLVIQMQRPSGEWVSANQNTTAFTGQVLSIPLRVRKLDAAASQLSALSEEEQALVSLVNDLNFDPFSSRGRLQNGSGTFQFQTVDRNKIDSEDQRIRLIANISNNSYEPDTLDINVTMDLQRPLVLGFQGKDEQNRSVTLGSLDVNNPDEFGGGGAFHVQFGNAPIQASENGQVSGQVAVGSKTRVKIWGDIDGVRSTNNDLLTSIEWWGDLPYKTMRSMFEDAQNVDYQTSGQNPDSVGNVVDFKNTFKNVKNLELGLGIPGWNVRSGRNFEGFLDGFVNEAFFNETYYYGQILDKWANSTFFEAQSGTSEAPIPFSAVNVTYPFASHLARQKLIDQKFWSISDAGIDVEKSHLRFAGEDLHIMTRRTSY
ncbi:MAG: BspA family leucine-rich repeat surface protein, partial [Anaerolineales bacterium]